MAKEKTPEQQALEREVKKQRKRIQQFVRRAQKRGFSFPENIVPTLPKKITEKTLSSYKAKTPEQLYKKAIYVSDEGTKIKGTERRKQERSIASKKSAQTRQRFYRAKSWVDYEIDNPYWDDAYEQAQQERESQQGYGPAPTTQVTFVLNKIRELIDSWTPRDIWSISLAELKRKDRDLLSSTFEGIIAREGENTVAARCEENAELLVSLVEQILYDSGDSYKSRGVDGVNRQIQLFAQIIMGRPLTVQESMEFTDFAEQTGVYE